MRILLVYPVPPRSRWPRGLIRSHWAPTGLAYLGTALRRAGHDVRIHVREEALVKRNFDWQAAEADLRRLLSEFRPDMVGFSAVTPLVPETAELAELVKDLLGPGVLTVAGGPHPSVLPERTRGECPAVDGVVIGEGEQTIVEVAERGRVERSGIDGGRLSAPVLAKIVIVPERDVVELIWQ